VLSVLRRRNFALLWVAGLVSVAGDWVLFAALPFYVFERTGSTIATAGMIVAELTPGVLLGSIAGVFVDRWERRRVLVVTNLLQAGVVALLLLVPHGWLSIVYVVAAAQSCVAAFSMPAESSLLPSLVEDEELVPANALNALNNRLARLVGVPVGGALLGFAGLPPVVLVDCASFVTAAVLVAAMSGATSPPAGVEESATAVARSAWSAFWGDWVEGMRLVRRERTITAIFAVLGLMTYGGTMLDPLYPAWVKDVLGQGPQVYAWLLTVHAVCGILGTVLLGRFGPHLTSRQLIGWSSLFAGAANLVKYNVPVLGLALSISAFVGVTSVLSSVGVQTLVQRGIPDRYRGRVFGALDASGALLSLLGAATAGLLGEVFGVVPMLDVASGLIVLAGLVVLRVFEPGGQAELSDSASASPGRAGC
jgi:MFS family permease